jgi:predicted lipoprotein with Yx(FWY)xxD motif
MTAAAGALALALAACGGNGDDGSETDAGNTPSGAAIVSVQDVDGSDVLVDSEGRTLYTADVEKGGNILCVDACTAFWEPLEASSDDAQQASDNLGAKLGVVERPEGDTQLTFDGLPLYTFTEEDAGQLEGDGFVDDFQGTHFEWDAARADASAAPQVDDAPNDDPGYDY